MMNHSNRGNSLIQVIIAMGLMSILAVSVTSMMSSQNREVKALSEKLLIQELEISAKNLFANQDYCSCLFRGQTFNTVTKSWSTGITRLPSSFNSVPAFPAGCTASANDIIPPANQNLSGSSMEVDNISLTDTIETSPNSGMYTANLKIAFKNQIRALKPFEMRIPFNIDASANTPTNRPFMSCSSAPTVSNLVWGVGYVNGQDIQGIVLNCPAGKKITGYIPRVPGVWPGHGCYGGFAIVYRQGCNIISDSSARCYNVYTPGQWDNWCWGGNWDEGGWLVCQ